MSDPTPTPLTDAEREQVCPTVVFVAADGFNSVAVRTPEEVYAAVERIVAARVAAARADEREVITAAVEAVLGRWSRPSLNDATEFAIDQVRAALTPSDPA